VAEEGRGENEVMQPGNPAANDAANAPANPAANAPPNAPANAAGYAANNAAKCCYHPEKPSTKFKTQCMSSASSSPGRSCRGKSASPHKRRSRNSSVRKLRPRAWGT
jgi:hypothetical protein